MVLKDGLLVARSVQSILRNQDASGAIVASPDFEQYRFCWLRDGSFCAYALDLAHEHEASARYHQWVADAIAGIARSIDTAIDAHERGEERERTLMPPARFALDGSTVVDDWPNFQIDGYGTWLWSLGRHLDMAGVVSSERVLESVERAARYLTAFALGPCYDVWEESGTDIHTSTLASVYGGLRTAARLLGNASYERTAENVKSYALESTVETGHFVKSSANNDVDASLLWLSQPFGLVEPSDPIFVATVGLIESGLTFEGGTRRYPADTYYGSGAWPVLTSSLGWHYLALGDGRGARRCRDWVSDHFDRFGRLGEQYGGERHDPTNYHEWEERWGRPAQDLVWSHAMYIVLSLKLEEFFDSSDEEDSMSMSESRSAWDRGGGTS